MAQQSTRPAISLVTCRDMAVACDLTNGGFSGLALRGGGVTHEVCELKRIDEDYFLTGELKNSMLRSRGAPSVQALDWRTDNGDAVSCSRHSDIKPAC